MDDFQYVTDYPELADQYDYDSKAIKLSEVDFVVSHGKCADGFMSRVIIEKDMRERPDYYDADLEDVIFVDAFHGADHSELYLEMKDRKVLICDFSFAPEIMANMIEATNGKILILDHHITAKNDLEDLDPKHKVFDMNHSGAFITQTFVHGFHNVPKAVLYVEDNDIWKKALPNTLEFTAYMFMQPFEYDSYVQLFDDVYVEKSAIPIGIGAVKQNQQHVESILKLAVPDFMEIKKRLYFVVRVNCAGILRSELGNQAMKKFAHANFAACFTQNNKYGSTSFSVRSLDDRSDGSFVAKQLGGGGHRNACGIGTQYLAEQIPGRIIDGSGGVYKLLNYTYEAFLHKGVGPIARKYNFLMINTPLFKTNLVNYLMQERYVSIVDSPKNLPRTEKDLPGYQEGMFVMRENKQDHELDTVYHGAVAWNYDGNDDYYYLTFRPADMISNAAMVILDQLQSEAPKHRKAEYVDGKTEVTDSTADADNADSDAEFESEFEYTLKKGVYYIRFKSTLYPNVNALGQRVLQMF